MSVLPMTDSDREAPLLGIDLGTSTCLACIIRDRKPVFIQPDRAFYPAGYNNMLAYDSDIMPSAFAQVAGAEYVGDRALRWLGERKHATSVVTEVKRLMDRPDKRIPVGNIEYTPVQISGKYVQALRRAAERQLKLDEGSIRGAVVAVPASFGQVQSQATLEACEIGGLVRSRIRLIDEPVAAAYSLRLHDEETEKVVLVADLGGGTFDVALLRVGKGVNESGYDELGRDGELYLGGLNWDHEIARRGLAALQARDGLDQDFVEAILDASSSGMHGRDGNTRAAHTVLYEAAQRAKKEFYGQFPPSGALPPSRSLRKISLDAQPSPGKRPCPADISAETHLSDTDGLVKRCVAVCERMFQDVSAAERRLYGWQNVDLIYLAGGGSYMATVRRAFAEAWGKNREPLISTEPQHAVALGAALAAEEMHRGRPVSHLQKLRYPHAVGVATYRSDGRGGDTREFSVIVPRNAPLPFRAPYNLPFPLFIRPNSRNRLRIIIEEQSDSLVTSPVFTNGDGHWRAHESNLGQGHQLVKTLWIPDLPPPIAGQKDEVVISVDAQADGILHFHIRCRGKELPYVYNRDAPP